MGSASDIGGRLAVSLWVCRVSVSFQHMTWTTSFCRLLIILGFQWSTGWLCAFLALGIRFFDQYRERLQSFFNAICL
ncbi:hypothetical protein BJX61DRAFT_459820 [Aspergillus egyptiacus]|nr:hypothetical protein BJX61DRAFT_459820 [Aspergillus egyptiacus]